MSDHFSFFGTLFLSDHAEKGLCPTHVPIKSSLDSFNPFSHAFPLDEESKSAKPPGARRGIGQKHSFCPQGEAPIVDREIK